MGVVLVVYTRELCNIRSAYFNWFGVQARCFLCFLSRFSGSGCCFSIIIYSWIVVEKVTRKGGEWKTIPSKKAPSP